MYDFLTHCGKGVLRSQFISIECDEGEKKMVVNLNKASINFFFSFRSSLKSALTVLYMSVEKQHSSN